MTAGVVLVIVDSDEQSFPVHSKLQWHLFMLVQTWKMRVKSFSDVLVVSDLPHFQNIQGCCGWLDILKCRCREKDWRMFGSHKPSFLRKAFHREPSHAQDIPLKAQKFHLLLFENKNVIHMMYRRFSNAYLHSYSSPLIEMIVLEKSLSIPSMIGLWSPSLHCKLPHWTFL